MTDLRAVAERIFRYFEPRAELCIEVPIAYVEYILREVVEDSIAESRKSAAFIKQTVCAKLIKEARSDALEQAALMLEKKCVHMDYCDSDKCNYAADVRALKDSK